MFQKYVFFPVSRKIKFKCLSDQKLETLHGLIFESEAVTVLCSRQSPTSKIQIALSHFVPVLHKNITYVSKTKIRLYLRH
jgi:hypothetical protein